MANTRTSITIPNDPFNSPDAIFIIAFAVC